MFVSLLLVLETNIGSILLTKMQLNFASNINIPAHIVSQLPASSEQPPWQGPTDTSEKPIRTLYLGHVTGYQLIRDQYFLIRSVPARNPTTCSI